MSSRAKSIVRRIGARMMGLSSLHRGIIFALDVFSSTLAGVIGYFCMLEILNKPFVPFRFTVAVLTIFIASIVVFEVFRFYKIIIRHANIQMLPRIISAIGVIAGILLSVLYVCHERILHPSLATLLYFFFACSLVIGSRLAMISGYYFFFRITEKNRGNGPARKVFIYGETEATIPFADYLNNVYTGKFQPIAYIDPTVEQSGRRINGLRLYGMNDLEQLKLDIKANVPETIIFMGKISRNALQGKIIDWCATSGVKLFRVPRMRDFEADEPVSINPVQIEDLLEREVITIEEDKIADQLTGKTIMVTGAAGSIGSEIVRQCCKFGPAKIIMLDCAESPLHHIRLEVEESFPHQIVVPAIADVRNIDRCRDLIVEHKPCIIFHAAAYKHVPLMEESPCEAVVTNVMGSINMANLAYENDVDTFVMVSTDKAVNPTNVMGSTKRAAEMYVQSLNAKLKEQGKHTCYITTRFGNVLGSNGSVVPRFHEQILKGGPVTVTHPDIIRFFMTIPEACRLVLQAGTMGDGGEIFVFDMGEPVKIAHLARRMIQLSGFKPDVDIKIEYTGLRPGEKLYEEVLSSTECTTETTHQKIRTALAIDNSFEEIRLKTDAIISSALARKKEQTVIGLKALIPEFKSKNSPWEVFDK